MTVAEDRADETTSLRRRAEEIALQEAARSPVIPETMPAEEIRRMLHELRVHEIELEMQNTELRRTQEELETSRRRYFDLYDLAPIGYCTISEQGQFLETNLTFSNLFGVDRGALIGQWLSRFILQEDQDIYYLQRKQLIESGQLQNCELRMVKVDATVFLAHLTATAAEESDGTSVHRIVLRDITEQQRAKEESKDLHAQLQQAQKMEAIGTLAGGIAHDFNNILGAIIGYAEMAEEDSVPGSMVENDIQQVLKAGHRAKDLVAQILAFSRQAEVQKFSLRPAVMIKESMKMLRAMLPATIQMRQDIDTEAGPILADPNQIHQIMMNLCTNALHAMEETGGVLAVSLKLTTVGREEAAPELHVKPGNYVQLSVSDTGTGISPEIRDKIFDPYFTTKRVGKGTGMGLAMVHGIVTGHDGWITCQSQLNEGTVFQVFLPVVSEDTLQEDNEVKVIAYGTERILFIDDEAMLAEMGGNMLSRLGYHVTIETNSLRALALFQENPQAFDLVITDQTMPDMPGSDLALRMLQLRPDLPIILCTGYSRLISEEKAGSLGIKGFALKPLAKKDIAALIRKVLAGGS